MQEQERKMVELPIEKIDVDITDTPNKLLTYVVKELVERANRAIQRGADSISAHFSNVADRENNPDGTHGCITVRASSYPEKTTEGRLPRIVADTAPPPLPTPRCPWCGRFLRSVNSELWRYCDYCSEKIWAPRSAEFTRRGVSNRRS